MSIIQLVKLALYAYIITVEERVSARLRKNRNEKNNLGIGATASDMLLIESLSEEIAEDTQRVESLRSIFSYSAKG